MFRGNVGGAEERMGNRYITSSVQPRIVRDRSIRKPETVRPEPILVGFARELQSEVTRAITSRLSRYIREPEESRDRGEASHVGLTSYPRPEVIISDLFIARASEREIAGGAQSIARFSPDMRGYQASASIPIKIR